MAEFSCLYYSSFTPSIVLTKKVRGLNKLHNALSSQWVGARIEQNGNVSNADHVLNQFPRWAFNHGTSCVHVFIPLITVPLSDLELISNGAVSIV